jgi:Zn-dependent protease
MLDWSIKLFRVRGIRLEVHFTFLILLAIFGHEGWTYAGATGVFWGCLLLISVFACVILHELGHSIMAMRYGVHVQRILLLPIGGMAQFDRIPREPTRELAITLAGPAVNFVLFGLLVLLLQDFSIDRITPFPLNLRQLAFSLAAINLVMGVFNLIPVFPMDGGRIFRALLALKVDYLTATRYASAVGKILATAGAAYALLAHQSYLTAALFAFIYLGGDLEYRYVRRQEMLNGVMVDDLIDRDFMVLPASTVYGDALDSAAERPGAALMAADNGRIVSVVDGRGRPQKRRPWMDHRTLGRCGEPAAAPLQGDWPVDFLYPRIVNSGRRFFPVYSLDRLIGLLDANHLDARLAERYAKPTKPQIRAR